MLLRSMSPSRPSNRDAACLDSGGNDDSNRQDQRISVLNPYESPQSASDSTPGEQSDAFRRSTICGLCISVAALLSLVGLLLCCSSALNPNTAVSEGQAAIGIWPLLNAPAAVAMGIGIYRKRQLISGLGLVFMVGSGCGIALFVQYF